jgi:DNA repair exonuclease SbcCD ATPase subunit
VPTSFRISTIRIEAFRGVTGVIELDLRSPLTLICAANGTGKTTVCDAAEWLLTGAVERLRDGQHFDESVLVSKFSTADPKVTATLSVGEEHWLLERTRGSVRFGRDASTASEILLSDLLAKLAPLAATTNVHPLTAISLRQRWLRGTYFLSSEAMAALIDTDEETLGRRKQVFADMLGIRHLLDAEDRLRRYVDAVAQGERSLARQAGEAQAALEELRRTLPSGHGLNATTVDELLRAENLLGIVRSSEGLSARLEQLAADFGRRELILRRMNDALAVVLQNWPRLEELSRFVEQQREEERSRTAAIDRMAETLRLTDNSLQSSALEVRAAEEEQGRLAEIRDITAPALARLVAQAESDRAPLSTAVALRDIATALPELGWSLSARHTRREAIRALLALANARPSLRERAAAIETRLRRLQLTSRSQEAMAALTDLVRQAEEHLADAQAQLNAVDEPLRRLQSEARVLLERSPSSSTCPVCGQDWLTHQGLLEAVDHVLRGAPTFVGGIRDSVLQATNNLESLRRDYTGSIRVLEEVDRLQRELNETLQPVRDFAEAARAIDFDPDQDDVTNKLEALAQRLSFVEDLARIISAATIRGRSLLEGTVLLRDAPGMLNGAISTQLQDTIGRLSDLKHRLTEAQTVRTRVAAEISDEKNRLGDCQLRLAQSRQSLQRIQDSWRVFASEAPMTNAELRAAQERVIGESRRLAAAEQHLVAARTALSYETGRQQLTEAERRLSAVSDRLDVIAARREAASERSPPFVLITPREAVNELASSAPW